jgi:hypothetical protein
MDGEEAGSPRKRKYEEDEEGAAPFSGQENVGTSHEAPHLPEVSTNPQAHSLPLKVERRVFQSGLPSTGVWVGCPCSTPVAGVSLRVGPFREKAQRVCVCLWTPVVVRLFVRVGRRRWEGSPSFKTPGDQEASHRCE